MILLHAFARSGFDDVAVALSLSQFGFVFRRQPPGPVIDLARESDLLQMSQPLHFLLGLAVSPICMGLKVPIADGAFGVCLALQSAVDFCPIFPFDAVASRTQIFPLISRPELTFGQFAAYFTDATADVVAIEGERLCRLL